MERDNLVVRFGKVIQNTWAILFRSIRFQGFNFAVSQAANVALVKDLSFELAPATSLLIRGQSGVGKTTLRRAIAGLWPYAEGTIAVATRLVPCGLN